MNDEIEMSWDMDNPRSHDHVYTLFNCHATENALVSVLKVLNFVLRTLYISCQESLIPLGQELGEIG